MTTGIMPGEDGGPVDSNSDSTGDNNGGPAQQTTTNPMAGTALGEINADAMNKMITELVTQAYGTKFPQRRNPDNES
jgi:hypothetical protein